MAYHHGDLRSALLDAAEQAVRRGGGAGVSLRALAREVGVSHTAPRHHFGDKRGVLTALAARGYRGLAARIAAAQQEGGFLEAGVAYVEYAVSEPGHFAVLFRPDMVDPQDPELVASLTRMRQVLAAGVRAHTADQRPTDPDRTAGDPLALAAWSMAHGFATLALAGNLPVRPGPELSDLARRSLSNLAGGASDADVPATPQG